jgi:hypothetical protein
MLITKRTDSAREIIGDAMRAAKSGRLGVTSGINRALLCQERSKFNRTGLSPNAQEAIRCKWGRAFDALQEKKGTPMPSVKNPEMAMENLVRHFGKQVKIKFVSEGKVRVLKGTLGKVWPHRGLLFYEDPLKPASWIIPFVGFDESIMKISRGWWRAALYRNSIIPKNYSFSKMPFGVEKGTPWAWQVYAVERQSFGEAHALKPGYGFKIFYTEHETAPLIRAEKPRRLGARFAEAFGF